VEEFWPGEEVENQIEIGETGYTQEVEGEQEQNFRANEEGERKQMRNYDSRSKKLCRGHGARRIGISVTLHGRYGYMFSLSGTCLVSML